MKEIEFKSKIKPSTCSKRPYEFLIPAKIRKETLIKIKNECLDIYGEDYSECNKRLVCFKKECLGRSLEWKSPTALPYLREFAKNVGINEGEDYFIKTNCEFCPIFNNCKSTCYQINDYIQRHKTQEVSINYRDTLDNYNDTSIIESLLDNNNDEIENLEIPYDCLNEVNKKVIKIYLFEQRDFSSVAKATGLANGAAAKKMFYYSLNRLSEWANMRKLIFEGKGKLTFTQLKILEKVYLENKSAVKAAKELEITKQSVIQTIKTVIKNNNIKFQTFVRKRNGKIIYFVPNLFK